MGTATEKKTQTLLAAAMRKLPKRLTCPKCGKSRAKDMFGLRVTARDGSGVPTWPPRHNF